VAAHELPSFDLVLATVDRTDDLERFLSSLDRQTHRGFRLVVVDQNDDDRLAGLLAGPELEILHLRSPRGLSRARNAALPHVTADLVAFPDDDCVYRPDLLERVGRRMLDAQLDGLTGRAVAADGTSSSSWKTDPATLTADNLWNRAISFAIFLRRELVERVGGFDESLGLGSGTPWSSGEEIDYLVRAVRSGARIEYDPDVAVQHEDAALDPDALRARGYRDGASVGYLLRKHGYPVRVRSRMLARPIGGTLIALARGDGVRARFHVATLSGRLNGLLGRR
jgi:GT2 family glycosyltransferase